LKKQSSEEVLPFEADSGLITTVLINLMVKFIAKKAIYIFFEK